jgi:hypothetical protein
VQLQRSRQPSAATEHRPANAELCNARQLTVSWSTAEGILLYFVMNKNGLMELNSSRVLDKFFKLACKKNGAVRSTRVTNTTALCMSFGAQSAFVEQASSPA